MKKFILFTMALCSWGFCDSAVLWNASTAYAGGQQVTFNGTLYQAAYWSQGAQPDKNSGPAGSGSPWILVSANTSTAVISNPVLPASISAPVSVSTPTPTPSTPTPTPIVVSSTGNLMTPITKPGISQWPTSVFAPYIDITLNNSVSTIQQALAAGVKFFVIAFVSGGSGCQPLLGTTPLANGANNGWFQALQSIRDAGGDFVISFGGANAWGTFGSATGDMSQACSTPQALATAYQNIITQLGLTYIDFDIEGLGVDPSNATAIKNHAAAMKIVQTNNPNLKVWYTFPVMPTGLLQDAQQVLQTIVQAGVVVDKVNIMAMDYGPSHTDMFTGAKSAATALQAYLQTLYPIKTAKQCWNMIGITPMIGQNDVPSEIFTLQNAQDLVSFAKSNGVGLMSMWSATRDYPGPYSCVASGITNQNPMDFSKALLQAQTQTGTVTQDLSATQSVEKIVPPIQTEPSSISTQILSPSSSQSLELDLNTVCSVAMKNPSIASQITKLVSQDKILLSQILNTVSSINNSTIRVDGTVKEQNSTAPVSNTQPIVVTYSGSWLSTWASDPSKVFEKFMNKGVTHLVLSFATPDLTYTSGSFSGTGLQYSSEFSVIQKAIQQVRTSGIKVLLAVGGATFGNWGPIANEATLPLAQASHTQALINLGNDLSVDGFDADYEVDANVSQYYNVLLSLRRAANALNGAKLLALPGWSVGGSCSSIAPCPNGKTSTFGSFVGRERALFSMIEKNNNALKLDLVTIMSYDGSNQFDARVAFDDYSSFVPLNIPLAVGLEVPPEGWGSMTLTLNNSDATCTSAKLVQDQYGTSLNNEPYSVESIINHVKKSKRPYGVMLWTLDKPSSSACSTQVSGETILQKALSVLKN